MMTLPGPDKAYTLHPSLPLIAELEATHGSLYLLAEDLLEKTLPLCEMIEVVKALYHHAGCAVEERVLDIFLLQQPCTEMLITFLLETLGPIEKHSAAPSRPFLDEMMKKFPDEK